MFFVTRENCRITKYREFCERSKKNWEINDFWLKISSDLLWQWSLIVKWNDQWFDEKHRVFFSFETKYVVDTSDVAKCIRNEIEYDIVDKICDVILRMMKSRI